ncbi:BspA family leucine-rich repeat surface protein [Levilactobacillus humaensis]|uniref:BspA family leucine-rich repeat surface protein n=1 Tax=Levilactobacillus humaensis TaxID=2950375 RepID=UPI0021C281C1|nr:BspA family leucine-rich repeat surface protein [Levilactobacillus humaensis]
MTKKLRITTKQKLTTLTILGVVAGMGLQVDTIHADTTDQGNGTDSSTKAQTTADDPTAKQAVLSKGTPAPETESKTDETDTKPSASDETVTSGKTTKETEGQTEPVKVTPPVTKKTDESVTSSVVPVDLESLTDKSATDADKLTDSTEKVMANLPRKMMSRMSLLRDTVPTITKRGANGKAKWTEDSNGVVTITGGVMDGMLLIQSATKLVFADNSVTVLPEDSSLLFALMPNLTEIDGWENVDASNVQNMSEMFSGDTSLESLDLSSLDLSHVTNLSSLLGGSASRPMSITSFKLGSSTNKATNMSNMLSWDTSLTDVDAADWNVSSLKSADSLFQGTAISNLDLSEWQTPELQNLRATFGDMPNLSSLDVAGLQTGKVTLFVQTFENDPLLKTVDVSRWDVSGSQKFTRMFYGDPLLSTLDLSNWHPKTDLQMLQMFFDDASLNSLDLSGFDTISSGQANSALENTTGLHELVLGPNTFQGTDAGNVALPDIPVTDMYTGLWQAVGTGTADKPNGETYTSAQLNTSAMKADTYVWQKVPGSTPTDPGTTPENPGSSTDNPGTPTEPTDPDTNPNTDGGNGATADGGENGGGTVTTDKNPQKKPENPVKNPQLPVKSNKESAATADKLLKFGSGQGAAGVLNKSHDQTHNAANNQTTSTTTTGHLDRQSEQTTLPRTTEKKSSLWVAIGAVMLGILSFHWYKRQD